ncbi:MAG TPA: PD-(D/E)XK nuclease family protein, partial [Gemmatimonadota bacterium]|nr:PD-(D/E)XK nuclease family protein [Gemmatimonadota bacterium]
ATARGRRGHAALERLPLGPGGPALRDWLAGPAAVPDDEVEPLAEFIERAVLPALGGATRVERELPFRLRLPGGGIVSGAIDCLWRDGEGRWHVWDYKFTDPGGAMEESHARQLGVYALAAAAALGLDEVHGALWYVGTGSARSFAWDREALAGLEAELDADFARIGEIDPEPDPVILQL